jgi:hypothetical protein
VFLFEVLTQETADWRGSVQCRIWSFVTAETVLNDLNQPGDITVVRPDMSPQQQLAIDLQLAPDRVQAMSALANPLWQCVPPELRDTGILAVTQKTGLDHLHELGGFPLSRLGTAIRAAAHRDDWAPDDPYTLFPPKTVTALPVDQQLMLAQSLVFRLLPEIPAQQRPLTTEPVSRSVRSRAQFHSVPLLGVRAGGKVFHMVPQS